MKEHIKISKFVKFEQVLGNRYEIKIFHKLLKIQDGLLLENHTFLSYFSSF
jgi:hypothetical protein